jgi:hypothetical protein
MLGQASEFRLADSLRQARLRAGKSPKSVETRLQLRTGATPCTPIPVNAIRAQSGHRLWLNGGTLVRFRCARATAG